MKVITAFMIILLVGACSSMPLKKESADQIKIIRDNYGTPHIYADSIYDLYYGYGYSIAQDRLFQMEMARRSTQGLVAEVYGTDYVDYDKNTRLLYDPASIRRQLAALEQKDKDIFDGYAAGFNAWLAKIRKNPDELTPKQFIDYGFSFTDWSGYDVAMIFIGTMNNRYGDFNTELDNATIYKELVQLHGKDKASKLFNLLIPRFTDNAPTTIPRENWSKPAPDSLADISITTQPVPTQLASISPVTTGMSNCYVIGKDKVKGANSILVNGPQFGWFNPAYTYSFGMHGAGINVVGNSPFGYPMVMFGHNKTISWGSTWGASDIVDIYAEKLNPDNSNQYFYKGKYIDLVHRLERIKVRAAEDVEFDVYRSVHGPIIRTDKDNHTVYAKHRAWDGGELDSLLSWIYATWAHDFDSWKQQAEKSAINVNMYFADVDGNIGYFHGGQFPKRVTGHDNRLPVSGDGNMDWQGRESIDLVNPHVQNPAGGFLANWNNKPAQGVMNPDFFFYNWSSADRVDFLHQALASQKQFTGNEAWSLLKASSYADVTAPYLLPLINTSITGTNDPALLEANKILQNWDLQSRDVDANGYYDEAATAIFRTFVSILVEKVLQDDLGKVYKYFAGSGYPTNLKASGAGTNIPTGLKAIVEALNGNAEFDILNGESSGQVITAALSESISQLTKQQPGSLSQLHLPVATRPYSTKNFLGILQAGKDEQIVAPLEQNRGTENNMVVMQPGEIVAYEVVPPGQSGFISPRGVKSKHYNDQFDLYNSFGKKRVWFYADDVEKNKASEVVINRVK